MKQRILISLMLLLAFAFATPAFAQTGNNTTAPPSNTTGNATINVTCVQAAVEKRDTAILSAFNTFSSAVVTALETRITDLKVAWEKATTSERRLALKDAWKKYKKSVTDARKQLRTAKRTSWQQFVQEAKTCKISGDPTTASVDNAI